MIKILHIIATSTVITTVSITPIIAISIFCNYISNRIAAICIISTLTTMAMTIITIITIIVTINTTVLPRFLLVLPVLLFHDYSCSYY